MSKTNTWIAALIVTGSLCVSAAVVKHVTTPPPLLPDVTPPPSATGDTNPADTKAWDRLTIVIDQQHCDHASLDALSEKTYWYQVLQPDHVRFDDDIRADKASIAEYQKVRGYILVDQQKMMERGVAIIEQMKDDSRSKTMARFMGLEQALAAEETRRQNAQKDELATLDQALDLAAIREERKTTTAEDAQWKSLIATLLQQQNTFNKTRDDTFANTHVDYERLNRLVGRISNYSYGRSLVGTVPCEVDVIRIAGESNIERHAQQILAR